METVVQINGEIWEKIYSTIGFCRFHGASRFIAVIPLGGDINGLRRVCEKCKSEDDLNEEVRD